MSERILILAVLLNLSLMVYLTYRVSQLPARIPFNPEEVHTAVEKYDMRKLIEKKKWKNS